MLSMMINLDESKDRWLRVAGRLNELGLVFKRISAVNGRMLMDKEIEALTYPLDHFETKVRFTRNLTRGEIGCFLSHRKCWEALVESGEKYAIVMEDDIRISSLAALYMKNDEWLPSECDICQLSSLGEKIKGRVKEKKFEIANGVEIVQPVSPAPLGTQCYIISAFAAKVALRMSQRLPCPVDNFLFSPWFVFSKIFPTWRLSPVLVVPDVQFDSVIGGRSRRSVQKASFFIRHGLTRIVLDRIVKRYQKNGVPYIFEFAGETVS